VHDEKLRNLYSSPIIIRMIKSMKKRLVLHVARMRDKRKRIRYLWKSQRKIDH
jgi:hypothetical protein